MNAFFLLLLAITALFYLSLISLFAREEIITISKTYCKERREDKKALRFPTIKLIAIKKMS